MNDTSKYWKLNQIDTLGRCQSEAKQSAKDFFNRQLSDVDTDKEIVRQLWQLYQGEGSLSAEECLRCIISHHMKTVCSQIAQQYGEQHDFTREELLILVLEHHREKEISLTARIMQTFDPEKSSLSAWTKKFVKTSKEVKIFLLEHGIDQISDWRLLKETNERRLQHILTDYHHLSNTEIQQFLALIASYQTVYLAQVQANRAKILSLDVTPYEESRTDFRTSVVNFNPGNNEQVSFLQKLRLPANFLFWFPPIIDYSLPPEQVYTTISACELLGSCPSETTEELTNFRLPIVLIVPGGDEEAGVDEGGDDNSLPPLPVAFWRGAAGWSDFWHGKPSFTGGEAHGYMIYQYLNQHLVIMVPSFWLVLLAAGLGKGLILLIRSHPEPRQVWLMRFAIATIIYTMISLQVYLSLAVVFPLFWPLVTMGNYLRLGLKDFRF